MGYDQDYFSWYESKIADSGIHFGIADALHRAFPDVHSVLEVGCGRGYILRHLAKLYPVARGMDISAYASQNPVVPELVIERQDISAVSGTQYSFAMVFSWQLLEHMPDEDAADRAINAMGKICRFMQVHSIRLVGSAEEDPTHTLLRDRRWWVARFSARGWFVDPTAQRLFEGAGKWWGNKELFVLRKS